MKTMALWIGFLCTALVVRAVELDLGANGKLAFDQPKGWTVKTASKPSASGVGREFGVEIQAPAGGRGYAQIQVFPYSKTPDQEVIRQKISKTAEGAKANRPGSELTPLNDFTLKSGYGSYAAVTSPQPGARDRGYKTYGVGLLQPGGGTSVLISFWADSADADEVKSIVAAMNTLQIKPK